MLKLKEDIPNESILSISHWILLINLKYGKLDCIEVKLNIIVMLGNGKLQYYGDLQIHVNH